MKFIFSSLIVCIFLNACTKDGPSNTDPCNGVSAKFAADVQPIINSSCANSASCHGTGSTNSGGALTDYNKIFTKRSEIKFQVENGLMPKTGALPTAEKNNIICWINSGAPNN